MALAEHEFLLREELDIAAHITTLNKLDTVDETLKTSTTIRNRLRDLERGILKAKSMDLSAGGDPERWKTHLGELDRLRGLLRSGVLSTKKRIESQSGGRGTLFAGVRASAPQLATGAGIITDLKRIRGQLSEQVTSADRTVAVLDASGQILRSAATEYRALGHSLKSAGGQLRAFSRREWTLRFLIFACLVLYVLVCFYILRKRVL